MGFLSDLQATNTSAPWIIIPFTLLLFYVKNKTYIPYPRWQTLTEQFLVLHSGRVQPLLQPFGHVPSPFLCENLIVAIILPFTDHSLTDDRHIWLWQCHQIYGTTSPCSRKIAGAFL